MDYTVGYAHPTILWDEAYAPVGVRAFPAGSLGAQSFGWFRNEINSLSGLRDLRFRTTGVAVDVMSKLGRLPQRWDSIKSAKPCKRKR